MSVSNFSGRAETQPVTSVQSFGLGKLRKGKIMNSTNQRKSRRRLICKLLLVAVTFVALTFPVPSRVTPVQADGEWNECDEAYIGNAVPGCISQYNQCLDGCNGNQACENSCLSSYQDCMGNAAYDRSTCLEGINPQPLPVNDDRWQMCLEGCMGCNEREDGNPLVCYSECRDYCNSMFPKP